MPKSNQKGGQFERDICRKLSLWVSGGKHDDLFWRSASSGGRATQRAKRGRRTANQYGDITATHPDGAAFLKKFTLELKKGYTKSNLQDLLDRPKTASHELTQWQEQAEKSRAGAETDYYMIIWQRDRCQPLVIVNGGPYGPWCFFKYFGFDNVPHINLKTNDGFNLVAFPLECLFEIDYDRFGNTFNLQTGDA